MTEARALSDDEWVEFVQTLQSEVELDRGSILMVNDQLCQVDYDWYEPKVEPLIVERGEAAEELASHANVSETGKAIGGYVWALARSLVDQHASPHSPTVHRGGAPGETFDIELHQKDDDDPHEAG